MEAHEPGKHHPDKDGYQCQRIILFADDFVVRLKTCFRMKLVGAPCAACADISCIVLTSNEMYGP